MGLQSHFYPTSATISIIVVQSMAMVSAIASYPVTGAISCASCVSVVTPAAPEHVKERPAKRAKVASAMARKNITRSGLPKRGRASCLSELPMMPLDIMFEVCSLHLVIQDTSEGRAVKIFSHLHPSDLLSLSRVNKEFRSQLLSSDFLSLWNACFRLCGTPTTPADMSPASWTHLLFGGAYCYVSNLCFYKLSTIKYKFHGPELRRETSNQNPVFISPSCVQVVYHNPVSLQLCCR